MYSENEFGDQLIRWRRDFHMFPETGFNERRTSDTLATALEILQLDVHRGIGGTGIVANLQVGSGPGVVGLRADMDALAMKEVAEGREHISRIDGCMHGCGHDGHMAMVLGAAKILTERRNFNGTVRFIFQPAEEHGRGAKAMIDDGLFERFPVDEIFAVHNMPGLPAGRIAIRDGGIMASEDNFVITVKGRGGHASAPHLTTDPLIVAGQILLALQTIVARSLDPSESGVVSCTEFFTDGIRNAIPSNVTIKGDTRSYTPVVQAMIERRMREICSGIAAAYGVDCEVLYTHEFAPTYNSPVQVRGAVAAATAVVGRENVNDNTPPVLGSEDFGAFLKVVPGAFAFIGNGVAGEPGGIPLHNAAYDFNDSILPIGARYLAELAVQRLPKAI